MAKVQVMCGKCDGRGKLHWLGHIDNGKCYACMGSGKVSANSVTEKQAAKVRAGCDLGSLEESGDRILTVNPKWAQGMVRRIAADMLVAADTQWARARLDRLPPGLRAAVIAAGRELKSA